MRILAYLGNKTKTVTVKSVSASSPHRLLECVVGRTFKIGDEIPEKVADSVRRLYPSTFRIDTVALDPFEKFVSDLCLIVKNSGLSEAETNAILSDFVSGNVTRRGRRKKDIQRLF